MSFTIKDLQNLTTSQEFQDFKKENEKYHILGEKIYGRRKDLWITQSELSRRSGIAQNKISQLESGTYGAPGIELLQNLALALEIDESYLIDEKIDRKTFEMYNAFLPYIELAHSWSMQFMKIPYFIDLEHYKDFWKLLSSFRYIRFNYGPFDKMVYTYQRIFSSHEKGFLNIQFHFLIPEERNIIKKVLSKYPCNDADELKKLSYETHPMKKIWATLWGFEHWQKELDFSL